MFSSTQPVRVGWNFKIEFISYKLLRYNIILTLGNKLFLLCLFEMRCL